MQYTAVVTYPILTLRGDLSPIIGLWSGIFRSNLMSTQVHCLSC